ncbi:ROK family transcriptional regulator [Sanguibacter suaedae]|uniref:ROK family transcriptional regulator n=1 Tax=Sanguibacter suaedae TaxID=2795737 RepID=A0A934I5X9_9MICO|nr:ROK family transcriptional regulator [Sanguibacter suaedae]MBI9113792.1 ROK family transcriptional regulator [Sanguibacter suaedae]
MAPRPAQTETRRRASRSGAPAAKILPADARIRHRALVLQELFDHGPASRADLARSTALARVTVSDVVSDLIEDQLVVELGVRPGTHMGKPATLVGINGPGAHVVCLDLSGDAVLRGALVDLEGTTVKTSTVKLNGKTGENAVTKTLTLVRRLVEASPSRVLGVGVGTPGVVSADGVVRRAPNLGWTDLDLRSRLEAETALPVYVANDANTAALAEETFGAGSATGLVLVEIGHGVGAGILLDGALLRGTDGTAGEIGHVNVVPDGPECSCGRRGCLESLVSAPRLRARTTGLSDAEVAGELSAAGRQLGLVLAPVTQALGLRDVVLSGPEDLLAGPFLQAAESTVLALTRPFGDERVRLRMSALGHDGVLVGAAAHVLDGELGLS